MKSWKTETRTETQRVPSFWKIWDKSAVQIGAGARRHLRWQWGAEKGLVKRLAQAVRKQQYKDSLIKGEAMKMKSLRRGDGTG